VRDLKICIRRNSIWRTAAILKIKYSLYVRNRLSDQNESLQEHVDWGRKQRGKLKSGYVKNSRWRTAAILEIENSQYFHDRSTDRDEILHEDADCGCNPCEKLKFAYLRNPI